MFVKEVNRKTRGNSQKGKKRKEAVMLKNPFAKVFFCIIGKPTKGKSQREKKKKHKEKQHAARGTL